MGDGDEVVGPGPSSRPTTPGALEVSKMRQELTAYAVDCVVRGSVDVPRGRLSDMLAAAEELSFERANLTALEDGRILELASLSVRLDELCLVVIEGDRGDAAKRVRTIAHRFLVEAGPYRITANLHTIPSADPLAWLRRRSRIVPMTAGVIEFRLAGEAAVGEANVLAVNRDHITSLLDAFARAQPADADLAPAMP
jgi:hypothetical protein